MWVASQVKVHVPRHLICSIKSPNQVVKLLNAFWNLSTYDGIRASQSRDTCFGSPCRLTDGSIHWKRHRFRMLAKTTDLGIATISGKAIEADLWRISLSLALYEYLSSSANPNSKFRRRRRRSLSPRGASDLHTINRRTRDGPGILVKKETPSVPGRLGSHFPHISASFSVPDCCPLTPRSSLPAPRSHSKWSKSWRSGTGAAEREGGWHDLNVKAGSSESRFPPRRAKARDPKSSD